MSSFVVILILCYIIYVNGDDRDTVDYCLWGRTVSNTTYVNGLYTYNDNGKQAAYWEKKDEDCPGNHLYLYKGGGRWVVSSILTDNPPESTVIAQCTAPTRTDYPTDCGDYWKVM